MSSQDTQQEIIPCSGDDSTTKKLSIHEQAAVQELKEMSGNNSWLYDQLEVVNIKTLSQQLTNMTKHSLPPASSSSDKQKNNKIPTRSSAQQKNRYCVQKQRSMSITSSGNCPTPALTQTQVKGDNHSNSNSICRLDIQDETSESSRMVSLSEEIEDSTQLSSQQQNSQQISQGLPPQYPSNNSLRRSPLDRVTLYPSRQAQSIFNPYRENESSSGWNSQQQQQQIQQQYSNRTNGENFQKSSQYSIQMQYYQHHQLYQFQAPSKQQQQNQQIPYNFQNEFASSSSQQSSGSLQLSKKYQCPQQSSQQSLIVACSSQQSALLENSPQFLVRLKSKFLKSASQNKRKLHSAQQSQQQKQQLLPYSHEGNLQTNSFSQNQNSLNEQFTENSSNNLAATGSQFFQPILNCFLADKLRLHEDIKNKRSSQQPKSTQVSSFSCKRSSGKINQQQLSNLLFRSPSESKSSFVNSNNAGNQEGENTSTNSTTANSSQHCSQQTRRPSCDYQFYQQQIPSRPSTSNCFRAQEHSSQAESIISSNNNLLQQERLVFYQDNEKENTPFLKKKQWVNPAFEDQAKIASSYQPTIAFDDRKMSMFNKPTQRGRIGSVLRENNSNPNNNILAQKENPQGDYSKRKQPTRERQKSFDDVGNYSEGEQKSKVKLEGYGVKRGRNIYSSSKEQMTNIEIPMLECSGKRLRE